MTKPRYVGFNLRNEFCVMCFIGRISYASRKMPQLGFELQEAF